METLAENELVEYDEDQKLTAFQKGKMTDEGLLCEDGTFIPRYKKEPRKGLTEEDEITITRWASDYHRDHPNIDFGLSHMICSWAYRHPEGCKEYIEKHKNKLVNMTDEERKDYLNNNPFEDLEQEYERVN